MTILGGSRVSGGQDTRFLPTELRYQDLGAGRALRLAHPEEFPEVGRVLQAAFSTGCWVSEWYHDHLAQIAARAAGAHVWVVGDGEGILGAVLTPKPECHRDAAFTFNILGVGPRGRGHNLGWQLTDHCVALARALGYGLLEIHSGPAMTAAHQLYYRYGFVRRPERETAVVDSGQRLLTLTYRITDPRPRPEFLPDAPSDPRTHIVSGGPTVSGGPAVSEESAVSLIDHRPEGSHDGDGQFVADPPERPGAVVLRPQGAYRLVTSLDSLRGRAALTARRLAGLTDRIEVVERPDAITPRLHDADGELISDDWRQLARSILGASDEGRVYYPAALREEIDTLDLFVHTDLVGGLERAVFAGSESVGRVAQRVVYARLGDLDLHLGRRRYVLGEVPTEADVALFAVLIGFDLEYRAQLGWGAASLVDYPNLWAYARGLLRLPGFADDDELVAVGLLPGATGRFSAAWGSPPAVEGVPDLRAAWLADDDRELPGT